MPESTRIAGLLHDVFHGELLDHQPGEAWHGPATLGLVQDLSAADAAKKPIPGGHSIWELVLHIANWNDIIVRRLAGETVEGLINTEFDWPQNASGTDAAWREAVDRLARSYDNLYKAISGATDEKLAQPAVNRKLSNYVMLHGIIHHIVYHSGQIGLLRKALSQAKS
jgi:uncharacterized damage-inducible protein DinB